MKKIKVEVQTTLTYTPFENIKELMVKQSEKDTKEGKKNGNI